MIKQSRFIDILMEFASRLIFEICNRFCVEINRNLCPKYCFNKKKKKKPDKTLPKISVELFDLTALIYTLKKVLYSLLYR